MGDAGNHDRFKARLAASHDAVWLVARWLWSYGMIVELRPSTTAPTHGEALQHVDAGDLWVVNPRANPPEKIRVEVKGSGKDFTCAEDYPFPMVRVCNVPSFTRHPVVAGRYYILNRARTHAALIDVQDTHLSWVTKDQQDPHYPGHAEQVYDCPKELVKFVPIVMKA